MSTMRFVCLLASTLAAAAVPMAVAQSPALQRGASVQMAATNNAAPMPDADNQNAWIITVVADGSLYLGVDPVSPENLTDQMKAHPRNRDQKLYIKADARAPYTNVEYALKAAHSAEFAAPILLTAQPPASGNLLPPSGLEVLVGPAPAGSVATVVELFNSGQQPVLKINDEQIPWPALQSTLTRHFQKGDERVVLVKADGRLPFADVARVIDSCRSAGAKVVLPGPSL